MNILAKMRGSPTREPARTTYVVSNATEVVDCINLAKYSFSFKVRDCVDKNTMMRLCGSDAAGQAMFKCTAKEFAALPSYAQQDKIEDGTESKMVLAVTAKYTSRNDEIWVNAYNVADA